ncbi:uncharacterized protein LOC118802487 [Colossoma macropomum]|uniref:uncharacterized protein LOC118802487 n=1 Tax=Colossoma macropomum TaxID=42526 RepID=UPI0018648787|nr:uncharacterized protein LOC118802487 [Colossoma macropomum]
MFSGSLLLITAYKCRTCKSEQSSEQVSYLSELRERLCLGEAVMTSRTSGNITAAVILILLKGAEGSEQSSLLKLLTVGVVAFLGVVVFLALIFIIAALWMWSKKGHSSAEETEQRDAAAVYDNISAQLFQPANREDDQDDIHYSSVYFRPSHSQEEPPFLTAKLPLDSTEEEDVQHAAVNQSLLAEAADDPSQTYSQIQKHKHAEALDPGKKAELFTVKQT